MKEANALSQSWDVAKTSAKIDKMRQKLDHSVNKFTVSTVCDTQHLSSCLIVDLGYVQPTCGKRNERGKKGARRSEK
jgi:hypothetical protein